MSALVREEQLVGVEHSQLNTVLVALVDYRLYIRWLDDYRKDGMTNAQQELALGIHQLVLRAGDGMQWRIIG